MSAARIITAAAGILLAVGLAGAAAGCGSTPAPRAVALSASASTSTGPSSSSAAPQQPSNTPMASVTPTVTQPASTMAAWEATSAATFMLGVDGGGNSILDNDLGVIQNTDSDLAGDPPSDWTVLRNDGKKLAADADAALANPMPPADPADYRAAVSEYAAAGTAMSNLNMADYNADTKAGAAYVTSWINSWDS